MTVADLLVARLRGAGVRAIFGVPGGGSNLELIEAAGRVGLPFVLTTTETAGALAALAQAEITGAPGACLTTLGPGAASVVNGVACAFLDRAPVVVFTDSHPASADGQFEHQRIDHRALMAPVTAWQTTLTAENAAAVIDEALARASGPRPGPVHIDCPGDVAGATIRDESSESGLRLSPAPDSPDRQSNRDRISALVSRARKPLLLVGVGARGRADTIAIRELCDRRQVPAMVTYKAKGVIPDRHPLFAGVFTNASIERDIIEESDLLIGIGLDPVELIPRPWQHRPPIVYCGRWPVENRHVPFAAQWIGDIASAVRQLEPCITSDWKAKHVGRHADRQRAALAIDASGMTPHRVVQIAAERLAESSRVVVDAGAHMFPATMLWPVDQRNGMLISNGLSTMGFAVAAAIGAALVDRGRPVVALTGDGGLLMCAGELLTAVRERLRVLTIVFSDASLSLIEIKQQARRYQPSGVALGTVAWPALAESLGLVAFRAESESELARAIDAAAEVDGPALVEARIDRTAYGATLRAVRG